MFGNKPVKHPCLAAGVVQAMPKQCVLPGIGEIRVKRKKLAAVAKGHDLRPGGDRHLIFLNGRWDLRVINPVQVTGKDRGKKFAADGLQAQTCLPAD